MNSYAFLFASLLLVVPLYIANNSLGIIYAMLWIDKIIFRSVTPSAAGIELVTISTVLLGIKFGAVYGFLLAVFLMPFLEGIKAIILPTQSDVPPFAPSPYHIGDGLVAVIAALLHFQLIAVVAVAILAKFVTDAVIDIYFAGKPFDIISAATSFVFNIALVLYAGDFLMI